MKKFLALLALGGFIGAYVYSDTPPPGKVTIVQPIAVVQPSPGLLHTTVDNFPNSSPFPTPIPFPNPANVLVTNSSPIPVSATVTFPSTQNVIIVNPSPVPVNGTVNVGNVSSFPTPNPNITNYAVESGGHLASIDTKLTNPLPVSASSLPLPTGASTSALQTSILSALGSPFQAGGSIGNSSFGISGLLPAFASPPTVNLGTIAGTATAANQTNGSQVTSVNNFPATQPISGTVTANQGLPGASPWPVTVSNPTAFPTPIPAITNYAVESGGHLASIDTKLTSPITVTGAFPTPPPTQVVTQSTGANLHADIDNFPATQPISAVSLPLPTGASTSALQTSGNSTLTSILSALGSPFQAGGSIGNTVFGATQSGAWNITNITGTVSLPTGAATAANQTTANTSLASIVTNTTGLSTSANQTNASQKTQVVDGSGNVNTSSTFNSKVGMSTVISGQDILTVTGTGSALNGDAIAATDVAAYRDLSLQLVVTGTNTTTFQGSNDNFTTVFSVFCNNQNAINAASVSTAAATGLFHCPVHYRYFRARVTAFTSGSDAGTAIFSPVTADNDLAMREVTIVGTPTVNTNPAVQTFGAQVASAAHTTTGVSAVVTQGAPNNNAVFELGVTAVSGTNPTLDLVFQESPDNGTTFIDVWHWERVTATGVFVTPNLTIYSTKFRFSWTITGTTPSFTFVINSLQGTGVGLEQARFFDRTISLTTGNSTSASWYTDGCLSYTISVNQSACTTFPTLAIQSSEDNVNFATTLGVLATTANGTAVSTTSQQPAHWSRITTTTAGTTCTLGYVSLRCTQN